MKKLFVISLIIGFGFPAFAQVPEAPKAKLTLTNGYARQLVPDPFEEFQGMHIGLNYFKNNVKRIGWDSQLSFNFVNDYETRFAITPLIGGRIYLNGIDKKHRYFFNLLTGPALILIGGDDYVETQFTFGYSGGIHMTTKHWQFGLAIERPEVVILKVGYTL